MTAPKGSTAVMARRVEAPDSLDFFPTPPWATRALLKFVLPRVEPIGVSTFHAWEPAAGAGHMAEVLREAFAEVYASDIHDYGRGYLVGDFVGEGFERIAVPGRVDWIITNPPFKAALAFARRGLEDARRGVALLVRTSWLEGGERFESLFRPCPPRCVAVFSERVPMVKGRWDPAASTATSYAWIVWAKPPARGTELVWIPPTARAGCSDPLDIRRFADAADLPLLGGAA